MSSQLLEAALQDFYGSCQPAQSLAAMLADVRRHLEEALAFYEDDPAGVDRQRGLRAALCLVDALIAAAAAARAEEAQPGRR